MKVGGQILWNVTPICQTSQIYYLMGRRLMQDVLGNHPKDRLFHLVHWLSITLLLRRISQESINLERKSYLDCSSDTLSTRGEFGRVTYSSKTLRSWKRWTHRKSTREDSMRKRWYFPNKENLFFQSQMDESKPLEEIRTWEHPPRYDSVQFKEKVNLIFMENSERSLPPPHDSLPDAGEATNDFWSMSGSFIFRHHVEPRVYFYSSREESFPIPLKLHWRYQNYSYESGCQAREAHWWLLEYWWLSRLVWSLDRFHTIYSTRRKSSWRKKLGPGGIDEKTAYHPGQIIYGQSNGNQWESTLSWRRTKNGLMKSSILKTHENCVESISSTLRTRNSKKTIKNARKKLETSVVPGMPCIIMKKLREWCIQYN